MNRMLLVSTCKKSCCGCLRPPFGGYVGDRAFDDLQQGLLDALTRHVAGDRGVVALATDLVDFIDVDDAALSALDVVIGVLQKLNDDVFDVLTDVASLGQGGRVRDCERHLEDLGQGLRQERLAAAGWAQQKDVALAELHILRSDLGVDAPCSDCRQPRRASSSLALDRPRSRPRSL